MRIHLAIIQGVMNPDLFAQGEFTPAEAVRTILSLFKNGFFKNAPDVE